MSLPDPNATNNLVTEPFGAGAANPAYITLPIPVPSQITSVVNQASFTDGFPPATSTPQASGGLPYFQQDMNGILYMTTANIAALAAGALPVFNAARASAIGGYPTGAILAAADGESYWLCTVGPNSVNPDTGFGNWAPVSKTGEFVLTITSGTYTLTPEQAKYPLIAFNGTLTGNAVVNFPAWTGNSWTVAAYTFGAYTITLQTVAAGNQVTLISGSGYSNAQNVFSDGTNLWSNNVSTAGLAPINSPALTGTPTAPTAASSSNTGQIATTAFSQAAIAAALAGYAPLASPTLSGVPTAPTPSPGDNSVRLATTAFVEAAIAAEAAPQLIRTGRFTCVNGVVSVTFSPAFPTSCDALSVQWLYNSPDTGYVNTGQPTRTGFTYQNGNAGQCSYIAIGH